MSTLDSILHSNMTVLTRDVYQRCVAPGATQAHYILVGRILVLVLLAAGYVLSIKTFAFLVTLVALSAEGHCSSCRPYSACVFRRGGS